MLGNDWVKSRKLKAESRNMKVTLLHHHCHNGIMHLEGSTIELPTGLAHWLINNGHARAAQVVEPATDKPQRPYSARRGVTNN